jgi:hypothetical protein
VFLQHMLATFRSTRVSTMSFELNEQQASLKVTLRCENGEQHSTGPGDHHLRNASKSVKCCMQKHFAGLSKATVAAIAQQ